MLKNLKGQVGRDGDVGCMWGESLMQGDEFASRIRKKEADGDV
jgi:hypothetical protein